ncbi:hypothetical protein PLICRDRAFT_45100 [Plicaturopsis crispa FD-325 SS-3]|uniref:Uncharacterized protein n=1 Tax=Plicaturopsis crispa FD-325 SS-3 TaxID=944288 RepID=A0A0C9SYE4_PLICR|nr:hypothetical protein PLICRDRAFT_45100 [Plicaturopsis crispa FD-325 SS-3]
MRRDRSPAHIPRGWCPAPLPRSTPYAGPGGARVYASARVSTRWGPRTRTTSVRTPHRPLPYVSTTPHTHRTPTVHASAYIAPAVFVVPSTPISRVAAHASAKPVEGGIAA